MHEVRLGEEGQVTLPKAIRDQYGLTKDDRLRMSDLGNGTMELILLKHSRDLPPPVIHPARYVSVKDMNKGVGKAASDRYKRSRKL